MIIIIPVKHFSKCNFNKAKKKKCYVALTRPKLKLGRSVGIFFFFRTVRELSFPIFFLSF